MLIDVRQTAWGSRDGADADDAYRMIRLEDGEKQEVFRRLIYPAAGA
jgi:hypothetical protein